MKKIGLILTVATLLVFAYVQVGGVECAWVLWKTLQHQPAGGSLSEKDWVLEAAYPDYNQCVRERTSLWEETKKVKQSSKSEVDKVLGGVLRGDYCLQRSPSYDRKILLPTR